MAKVDDLLKRRAKQVVLAIVARLAHRSPPTANLAVEGITDRPNRESQTARKPACTPGFLVQNRLLAQVKSSRSINSFRNSHGPPLNGAPGRPAGRATRQEASPPCRRRRSVYRTLNLPRGSREVLGLDLNCSESTGTGPSFPYLQKARSPHDEGRPVKVEGQTAEVRRWGVRLSLRFL